MAEKTVMYYQMNTKPYHFRHRVLLHPQKGLLQKSALEIVGYSMAYCYLEDRFLNGTAA